MLIDSVRNLLNTQSKNLTLAQKILIVTMPNKVMIVHKALYRCAAVLANHDAGNGHMAYPQGR